ncbi:MAG: polysaccharide deacetylase family protein [Clostridia bacterium]|nr:polysaccharide deacetylase family protein [Clostridia bacterium]
MMFKSKLIGVILTILFTVTTLSTFVRAVELEYPIKKILIVYSERYVFGYKTDYINAFGLLLKHFNTEVTYQDIRDYKAGEVEKYDIAFYIGLDKSEKIKDELIMDFAVTRKKVCWVGSDMERFLKGKKDLGIEYLGISNDYVYSTYQGKSYLEKRKFRDILFKPSTAGSKEWASISNGSVSYPYILSQGNIWLFSRLDMGEDAGNYIMADVLHELVGEDHEEKRKAFIRVEDIHPFRDPGETKETLDILVRNDIPFMMAVIPAYYNGGNNTLTYLNDKSRLIDVIKYGTEHGGSIILHGFTHQESSSATGEGFEFWDAKRDRPLNINEEMYLRDRLNNGVLECIRNDIYPIAFEPPHYAMSQKGYDVLKEMFSTLVAQIQTSDEGFSTISYPYMLYNTYCAEYVVPENLSYVDPKKVDPVDEIKEKAKKLQIVRDSVAGAFFHPYVKTEYLEEVVKTLKDEGYEFFDLKSLPNRVYTKNVQISTNEKEIQFQLENTTLQKLKADKESFIAKSVRLYTWGIFGIVAFFCLAFLLIYIIMRRKETKSLFEKKGER